MNTGERMRTARKRMRLTQKDIAGNEFHRSLISQIETGLIEPSTNTLGVLADRLGVPPAFFMETPGEEGRTEQTIREAEKLLKQNKIDEAYKMVLDTLPTISSLRLKGRLLTFAGSFLSRWNRNKEALVHLEMAQRYYRFDENALGLIECLFQTGKVYAQLNQTKTALDNYNMAIAIINWKADEPNSDRSYFNGRLIHLYLNAGIELANLGKSELSMKRLRIAAELAIQYDLHLDLGIIQQQMGNVRFNAGDYKEALQHFRAALRCFDQKEHSFYRAQSLLGLGKTESAQNNLSSAISYYLEALEESSSHPTLSPVISAKLANLYNDQKDKEKALYWGMKAIEQLSTQVEIGEPLQAAVVQGIFSLVGDLYKEDNQLTKARSLYKKGIEWCIEQKLLSTALYLTDQLHHLGDE